MSDCRQLANANHAQLYDTLVRELTSVVVFLMDSTGCIASWNPAVERILGYAEAEWLGQSVECIFTPEDRAQKRHLQEITIATREGRAPDTRWHLRKNGERFFVQGTLVALHGDDGQILGFSKVMQDITEKRTNEQRNAFLVQLDDALRPLADPAETMRMAAQLLGEHLDADRCTYCHVAADGEHFEILWDYVRPGMASMKGRYQLAQFGTTVAGLLRSNQPCIVEDTESDPSIAEVRESYRQPRVRAHASVPLQKAGKLVAIMAVHQQTPRRWQPAEIDLVHVVINRCWESIERARAEGEVRQQWRTFDTALAHTPDLIYIFDRNDRLTYANRLLLTMWQRPLHEVVGKTMAELGYPPESVARHRRQVELILLTRQPRRDEATFTGPDGQTRDYEYIYTPIVAADGTVEGVTGSARDITERKRAQKELLQSHRELEEFAYVASHDLQEPLRMVNIYTQLMLKDVKQQDPTLDVYAGFIRQGVTRMKALIEDLLTYSRAIHEEQLPVGVADLSASLQEALAVLQGRVEESGAIITAPPQLPTVRGDTKQMAHVFQNLLSNALKYCRPQTTPEIRISAGEDGAEWVCSVQDNGIGFEQQYADRIFGLFKRLHKEEYPGTGLGLAICQRIVERYGGRMWAEGRPGLGATFFFALPRVNEA